MELEGAERCFAFIRNCGLSVPVFISDRHRGIAKWIRCHQKQTQHFFDIWHIAKSIVKKVLKASKEKGCEVLQKWTKGIKTHIYWCATSTKPGFGEMIVAKWKSKISCAMYAIYMMTILMNYIRNVPMKN